MTPGTGSAFRADKGETWTCSAIGAPGPIPLFTIEMYEKDDGFFGECIDGLFDFGCVFSNGPVHSNDDLIGHRRHVWYPTLEELVAVLPNVGDSFEESMRFACKYGEFGPWVCPRGLFEPTGPEYEFTWRVTRLSNGPVLDPSPGNSPQADAR
jgi:hypothetical protein